MFELFLKERNEILKSIDGLTLNEVIKRYKFDNDDYSERVSTLLNWDYELMYCKVSSSITRDKYEAWLTHQIEFDDGKKYPNIEEFEPDRVEFYKSCAVHTDNKWMVIRYLDYLVDNGERSEKYKTAIQLTNELLLMLERDLSQRNSFSLCLSRIVEISLKFNLVDQIDMVKKIIIKDINRLSKEENYRTVIDLSQILYDIHTYKQKRNLDDESVKLVINTLTLGKEHYEKQKEYGLFRMIIEKLILWHKCQGNCDDILFKLELAFGISYELEGEYQSGRSDKDLYKASHTEKAIKHLISITSSLKGEKKDIVRTQVNRLKTDLKKTYRDVELNNFKKTEMFSIEKGKLKREESTRQTVKDIGLKSFFKKFSESEEYTLSVEQVEEISKESFGKSIFFSAGIIQGISTIHQGKKIHGSANGNESELDNFAMTYSLVLIAFHSIYFSSDWDVLVENGLNSETVIERVCNWDYMLPNNQSIVEQGIRRFFEKDYISCLHILVPQFENAFRVFFEKKGYSTTSIKGDVQHEITFNDFLKKDFVLSNVDVDLLFLIKHAMIENSGINLRNHIAHGLIGVEELNKLNCLIVLHLYFQLRNMNLASFE